MSRFLLISLFPSLVLFGCDQGPDGLRVTPEGSGPVVVVDWDAEPLPEIPFPNDLATRADPTSITGLRLNISEVAMTQTERDARMKLNELVGFGIYAPISLSFEAPLDLANIVARHQDDNDQSDDAFFVIDVTEGSPTFMQAVALDVGHGRYPMDLKETDRYFENDVMWDQPGLIFDTRDEDLNGNGVLDFGEDTDGDGYLDVPNVYPEGGDPLYDMLTWYERLTDTLIFRPVVPLREETTYAVVVTERLIGLDGEPIRSPWEFVNHTRQTDTLAPVEAAISEFGLSVDDIAFSWSFTTGRVTGDLVDIRRGLDGEGPWPFLGEDYPSGVLEALPIHNIEGIENIYALPIERIMELLVTMGFFPPTSQGLLVGGYEAWADNIVGGSYETINFLADRDDGGFDMADEWWQLDPVAGTVSAEPERIVFTCVIPKEEDGYEQPFPVAFFGHGYKSSRFDFLAFSQAIAQVGIAACAVDYPGHGPTVDPDDMELINELLPPAGLYPFYNHLLDSRYVDLNNDGQGESGGDQWIADPFHTRDMVRQAVVDWMMLHRSFSLCGEGTMSMGGEEVLSCDWDGNGVPDLGGPGHDAFAVGGSLGGIITAIFAAVEPDLVASASIVPGGGLMDVGGRSPLPGVVEAVHGRLMTPIVVGIPDDEGLMVVQIVNSVTHMVEIPVGRLDSIPVGGRVVVENLDNGDIREIAMPEDGTFRVGIAADAADYFERRELSGMPLDGPVAGDVYMVDNNEDFGDRLVVFVYDANGDEIAVFDTFLEDVAVEGVTFAAGSTLVAGSHGLGHIRATPEYRRLIMVTAMATEPGDPISYMSHLVEEPFEELGGEPANHLLMPCPGDMIVPIATGIALARAAGFIEMEEVDDRYGTTVDRWLMDRFVVNGIASHGPYTQADGTPMLFDADDLDNGTDDFDAPSEAPLRITKETSSGVVGLRLPYIKPDGQHGFQTPNPELGFDINSFAINQIARYFQTLGQELSDEPCLATWDCDFMREIEQ